jgi:hypothetical protein
VELANGFLEAARGFAVPAGSVLVLTSASHLAWVGAGAYAQDFLAARQKLRAAYRGGVEVLHCIPLLVSGVNETVAAAAIREFFLWLRQASTGRNICQTLDVFLKKIPVCDAGRPVSGPPLASEEAAVSPLAAVPHRILLPADLSGRSNAVFEISHEANYKIQPFQADTCDEILLSLTTELNSKFMANLADPLQLEQWPAERESETEEDAGPHLVLVGGSHTARMAEAAESLGYKVTDLSRPGLRITEDVMEDMATELRELIAGCDDNPVIIFR